MELARDRSRGVGRAHPEEVLEAWQACLGADPTDEEVAAALMQLYVAHGRRPAAVAVYERCRAALADLGLRTSPALEEVRANAEDRALALTTKNAPVGPRLVGVRQGEERRLVSVVFVDLNPAGLGRQVDPEDLRELTSAGLAQTLSEVEAFGGTVVSISGFGMSVLFGAPQSHEDDPERALRAALRIAAAVGQPEPHGKAVPGRRAGPMAAAQTALSVRIGVESGTAVVGPIGDGDQRLYGAVGEVVGVAAALQAAAKPGTVLVGPATRAAAEEIFEWGPAQDIPVPSGDDPVRGSYLVGARPRPDAESGRRRLAARAALVGRGVELAVLTDAVRAVVAGRGGAVVVVAEPGIGKTRLVGDCRKFFMGWVGATSGRLPLWLEGRCASYASSTPYGAYQQLLCRFIGAPLEAGEAVVRPALGSALRAVFGKDSDLLPVLAHLMGMAPGPGGEHLGRMAPAELQHITFAAMRSLLAKLVSRGPTVLALEDVHWSDPTSLRLTADLGSLASDGPLLVLVTRRPEPDPGVGELQASLRQGLGHAARVLDLAPIQAPDERALARSLVGGAVDDKVLEGVCEGADGNPLFLEERVASLLDTGLLHRDGPSWRLGHDGRAPLPEALERLVRSRADRLSIPAREVMVAASVLGQEIERAALGVVSELDVELDDAVAEVVSAGLIVEVSRSTGPLYRFRHALIREAMYSGLLRSQRRQLHARAAWDLEARSSDRLDEVAAVLGGHFAAARIFANDEAIGLYRQTLAVIDGDAKAVGTRNGVLGQIQNTTAVAVCGRLAALLMLVDRFDEARSVALDGLARTPVDDILKAARLQHLLAKIERQEDHRAAAADALETAEKLIGPCGLNDDQERVDVWLAVQLDKAVLASQGNELRRAASVLATVRPLVEAKGSAMAVAYFYSCLSQQHIRERRYRVDAEIVEEHRRAANAAHALEGTTWDMGNPETERFFTLFTFGVALTWHGDLDEARQAHNQVLANVERVGTRNGRCMALTQLAVIACRQGDVELVRELVAQARAAAAAGANGYYVAAATAALEAWVAWRDHRTEQVIALGTEALRLWEPDREVYPFRCLALFPLMSAYLDLGRTEKAVDAARQSLEPREARLPDELEAAVQAACDAWDKGEPDEAGRLVGEAVALAVKLRYA